MNGINWGNNGIINNPYNFVPQLQMPAPQMQVTRVSGENGANAFQMGPNSSALLLDETAPIVWFVQTDGAGYKTCRGSRTNAGQTIRRYYFCFCRWAI